MSETSNDSYHWRDKPGKRQSQGNEFSVLLGMVESGRLVFASGASHLSLKSDQSMPDLYRGRFRGDVPGIQFSQDTLTIRYRSFPLVGRRVDSRRPSAEVALNGSIPWEIEFHKGVFVFDADLSGLQLRSLDVLGDVSEIALKLARPVGVTFIYISGKISKAIISRPFGVGLRLRIDGSLSKLVFDNQRFEVLDGKTSLESPNSNRATGRYELYINGMASNLTIIEEV